MFQLTLSIASIIQHNPTPLQITDRAANYLIVENAHQYIV